MKSYEKSKNYGQLPTQDNWITPNFQVDLFILLFGRSLTTNSLESSHLQLIRSYTAAGLSYR